MKRLRLILTKITILIAAPHLWLWTHFFLLQNQTNTTTKVVTKLPKKTIDKSKPLLITLMCFNFFFNVQTATCQDYIDIIKLNYNYTSSNTFKDSESKTTIAELDLDATLPVVINESVTFITGLLGEAFRVKLDPEELSKNIYSISPKLGVNLQHGEKWSGSYILLPKIASDFEEISRKDFQIGGLVLLKYSQKPNRNFKVGVYANSELFGPWVVPLLGLYSTSSSGKWEVNLTLPFLADVNYSINDKLATGLSFNGITKSYHLTTTRYTDAPGYLVRATNEFYWYASIKALKNIVIQPKVGHSIGRYYRVYDEDDRVSFGMPLFFFDDNRTQLNADFTDGWVFQVMAIYRIQLGVK